MNMLKDPTSNYMADMITEENGDDIVFWKDGEPDSISLAVLISKTISSEMLREQKEELSTLVAGFSQVFRISLAILHWQKQD